MPLRRDNHTVWLGFELSDRMAKSSRRRISTAPRLRTPGLRLPSHALQSWVGAWRSTTRGSGRSSMTRAASPPRPAALHDRVDSSTRVGRAGGFNRSTATALGRRGVCAYGALYGAVYQRN